MAQGKKIQKPKPKSGMLYLTFFILLSAAAYGSYQYGKMSGNILKTPDIVVNADDDGIIFEDDLIKGNEKEDRSEERATIKVAPKPKRLKRIHYVRVASCFFDSCRLSFVKKLKASGYNTFQKAIHKKVMYYELISKDLLKYDDAKSVSRQINYSNKMAGNASLKNSGTGFKISLGIFPEQKFAENLQDYISGIHTTFQIVFEINKVDRLLSKTAVYAGPFYNKLKAKKALAILKKDSIFRDSFITTIQ